VDGVLINKKMSGEPEGTKALPKQVDVNRLRCKQDAVCQKQGRCGPIRRYNKLIYQELTAIARISGKNAVFKKMLHGVNVGCFVGLQPTRIAVRLGSYLKSHSEHSEESCWNSDCG
jgi:hypothetical protein